ncbi:TRAP transporter substrate-binding protein [Sulfitobacter sp. F26204]|uniref:TRAP transporter substrate-binding protein n=1 Tax=Sulfitobacter sp. F26204 TaxID=2996014 RepID=UPI00225E3B07|nr:TRAP transporter substrate-binding protein [Sulfitobacter sp. F26204]MCX7561733.1 TRAP transporter substrate-binding protein [Sulfitobacter sp. F26204]
MPQMRKRISVLLMAVTVLLPMPAAADKIRLDVQSAFPLATPSAGENATYFGDRINRLSHGELEVKVYGAGKLVPSLQIFDAVQQGTLDAGMTSPHYVAGRFPAVQFFGGAPFGLDPVRHADWIYNGGGGEIWSEIYEAQGVKTIPCGLMGAESGGWYNFRIESTEDLKGKKIRFAGLAGSVMAKLGASVVLLPLSEVYPGLERGVIDGAEVSMPAIDTLFGLQQVSQYFYLPGWHQPSAMNELIINLNKWDSFDAEQQSLIYETCKAINLSSIMSTETLNAKAVSDFEAAGVEILPFPDTVLNDLRMAFDSVVTEQASKDGDFRRVWDSLQAYRADISAWSDRN